MAAVLQLGGMWLQVVRGAGERWGEEPPGRREGGVQQHGAASGVTGGLLPQQDGHTVSTQHHNTQKKHTTQQHLPANIPPSRAAINHQPLRLKSTFSYSLCPCLVVSWYLEELVATDWLTSMLFVIVGLNKVKKGEKSLVSDGKCSLSKLFVCNVGLDQ